MKRLHFLVLLLIVTTSINYSQNKFSTFAEKINSAEKHTGFFTFYWDEFSGKIWLEIDKLEDDFIYVESLPWGVGSNDIGLDRGQLGRTKIVHFEKHGPKILLVQNNLKYRASTDNKAEQKAVEESFAKSVLYGFDIAAKEKDKYLIDASEFFLRDAHEVVEYLKYADQGSFSLDNSKSAFYLKNTKSFPLNTEIEVILTFAGNDPGNYVRSVVPTPNLITVHERHSFVKLPDNNFEPRKDDPRAGYFGITYYDYSAPLGEPLEKMFIARHRLKKKDPSAEISEPVEPIIYYVDSGAPEPVKSALIEGASWWNQAFEAAGYKNAFLVKELPKDADPLDIRYNVIQWVHRATRGWSYGWGVIDPRTGEIIKGHVTLGSLRIRQDYLIGEGLLSPYKTKDSKSNEMKEMALARIRQLAAHEVGHTLGLNHNFAASTYGRASVMDYPHPLIKLNDDGTLDLSEAYDVNIGKWDKVAIKYGYSDFPSGVNEEKALNKIVDDAIENKMLYISDDDARPEGGLNSYAHLWDNGESPVDELSRIMKVRKVALDNFSENAIQFGTPMAKLEDVLAPVYLMHRYQVEAASKVLGGAFYTYKVRGDKQTAIEIVDGKEQKRALDELLKTITPENLLIPERILKLIPPQPEGYGKTRENFESYTGLSFDPISAAQAAANQTLRLIFNPQRCTRLVENNDRNSEYPSLSFVIDQTLASTWKQTFDNEYSNEINRTVSNLVLSYLLKLAGDESTFAQVNAVALLKVNELKSWIEGKLNQTTSENEKAHFELALHKIKMFKEDPGEYKFDEPAKIPDGSPIGCGL